MRSPMALVTGRFWKYDWPRSPWRALPSHSLYRTGNDSSRLSCWRTVLAATGSPAAGPRMATVGSPGSRLMSRKLSAVTASRTETRRPRRERIVSIAGYWLTQIDDNGMTPGSAPP